MWLQFVNPLKCLQQPDSGLSLLHPFLGRQCVKCLGDRLLCPGLEQWMSHLVLSLYTYAFLPLSFPLFREGIVY